MGTPPPDRGGARESAGGSALGEALQLADGIWCVQRQIAGLTEVLQDLRGRQGRFLAGGTGERRVVRVLVDMVDTGWTVLADRRWPGTRRANIDVLLAGPGGVFVVDVKTWRDVRVDHGRLWHGDAPADDAVTRLLDQAAAVQAVLIEEGLPPSEVVPLLVLAGRRSARATLGQILVLGEYDLSMDLLRRGSRLGPDQVERVVSCLETKCPPMAAEPSPARRRSGSEPASAPALIDLEQVWAGLVDAAASEPIEAWMTWLHPSQSRLIGRTWNGPARIRGAAGTGKTVVALHRARHLAQQGRRVLFASYVNSLGPIFAGLFARLAPDLTDRVEFASVHQVAVRLLRATGTTVTIDQAALDDCHARAWSATHRDGVLETLGHAPGYWRDEIAHVIKGRGITQQATYLDLPRIGRGTALQLSHRAAVWRLYQEYERRLKERGLIDWEDVLLRALHAVRTGAVEPGWDAVIVDEVQDLTCVGLQLLHSLTGDRPDGLLMVGDGQQAVYPGGFTLAEAGISVVGRAVVLDRNYRNGADILRHALAELGQDTFEDLDPAPADADRLVHPTRPGGVVVHAVVDDPASQQMALLEHLTTLHDSAGARFGDIAILVPTNAAARTWQTVLTRAAIPAILLIDYDGRTVDAVKVGTFERGKGLDFTHVLVPDRDLVPAPRRAHESDEAYAERARLERRRLYVAMIRARDTLWLATGATRHTDRN